MAMDCETCQPTLLDLVHGELDPVLATQVQQHMAGCADCRADMERLTMGLDLARQLPVVEPPSALGERLLELAASRAEQVRRARAPKRRSLWQRLLDFTGQFAMTPQVGMATISLLIVAVGLWSVPRLTREPEAAGVTVVNPDPEGQAGPSAGVQPAERLDLAVDTRGKRIRPREDAIELARRAEAAPQGAAAPAGPAAAPASSIAMPQPQMAAPAELAEAADPALEEKDALRSAGSMPGDESPKPAPDFAKRAKAKESESALEYELGAMAAADSANGAEGVAPAQEVAKGERFAAAPPPPSAATASAAGPGAGALDDRAGGGSAQAAQADGLVARKAPAPAKAPSTGSPASALKDVRALQASGGCRAAVPGYERLIAAFPSSSEAGEATLALAACYRSLGQEALARQLLDRALRRPATAARARAMLAPPAADRKTLDTQERK